MSKNETVTFPMEATPKEPLDQTFLGLDAAAFDHIEAMLAKPAKANPKLVRLFKSRVEWVA